MIYVVWGDSTCLNEYYNTNESAMVGIETQGRGDVYIVSGYMRCI